MTAERHSSPRCVADVEGPWSDANFDSSLVARCRRYWMVPMEELPNGILAMFLRQCIAVTIVGPEARERLAGGIDDGSEQYDGELAEAVRQIEDT